MNNKITAVIATAVATTIVGAGVVTVLAIKSHKEKCEIRKISKETKKMMDELLKEEQEICK